MIASQKSRDLRLDALKMFLIILVIYAHIPLLDGLISGLRVECDTLMWHSVKGIYSFHMPLFVLLSGYFTKRKTAKNMFRSSLKLLRLFIVFHGIDLLLRYIHGEVSFSIRNIITPSFALWYLLCLFYWRLSVVLIPNKIARKYVVFFSIILSLLVGFVHIRGELGFQRFFSFMPYFFIGYYYGKEIMSKINTLLNKITPPNSFYYC